MTRDVEQRRRVLEEFGLRLRAAREEAGMTQQQLAAAANIHRVTIARVEAGTRELGLTSIVALAEALSVETGSLVQGLAGR